ncbi:hypothetical protein [Arsenophonus endosymbiont of Bemisia tabaci]|uniref:hypothetical protein n=1 Tax=Arsenophonus endosymbiont of Bemisia tabaci TaxID=536059 RepID=UPI0015F6569F|nr:hypothetical protein [Arsenophonus endosymbiont of Bemisia tabaci]
MEEKYKKIIDWIKSLRPAPTLSNQVYDSDSKLTLSTGDIAKHLNFDYKIYVFLQYKFTDIE